MRLVEPAVPAPLDPSFRPAALATKAFRLELAASGKARPVAIALERGEGLVSTFRTEVFAPDAPQAQSNLMYTERIVKFLLWQRGGWRVIVGGAADLAEHIRQVYSPAGARAFDEDFMGGVYERPFTVDSVPLDEVPESNESARAVGGHLEGCRIGFDLGASDYKVAAVVDGETVFAEETVWDPRNQSDPSYHREHLIAGLKNAAQHLPRVDAIGGSSAGIYINNRVRVASLFRGVPRDLFDARVADMFVEIGREWGCPLEVINDGDVTALAGALSLQDQPVLGIAMGSSEAVGYVNSAGGINGWLNELAFAPFDYQPDVVADEWSGDRGVGATHLCQVGAVRLAEAAGVEFPEGLTVPEKLAHIQSRMAAGDERVPPVYESIGSYLGYAIAHYADFYELKHVLVLGRVTSGPGGPLLVERANTVLSTEFPDLASRVSVNLPDERSRRVGQAIAAASLPALG